MAADPRTLVTVRWGHSRRAGHLMPRPLMHARPDEVAVQFQTHGARIAWLFPRSEVEFIAPPLPEARP